MTVLWAETALLPEGFADAVRLEIDERGDLRRSGAVPTPAGGRAVARRRPARACRTCTATRSSGRWRGSPSASSRARRRSGPGATVMYRFLERIGPDELRAIAAQLYVEMLEAGYTAVGEFHYLHHQPRRAALRRPGGDVLGDPRGAAREPASA